MTSGQETIGTRTGTGPGPGSFPRSSLIVTFVTFMTLLVFVNDPEQDRAKLLRPEMIETGTGDRDTYPSLGTGKCGMGLVIVLTNIQQHHYPEVVKL